MIEKIRIEEFDNIKEFYKILLKKQIITIEEFESELEEMKKRIDGQCKKRPYT